MPGVRCLGPARGGVARAHVAEKQGSQYVCEEQDWVGDDIGSSTFAQYPYQNGSVVLGTM
ncbi:hypothetical protein GJ744_006077 [Endocarpon pusillum]|uniref:Uncharacterized protein n=1 Tax=Endocarpon pusillum TaxID=364733 RepID=A0A8H7API2_9EURO|nr:hypothetical protein GJ744_006077 [Endocarpon pusillum]